MYTIKKIKKRFLYFIALLFCFIFLVACGGKSGSSLTESQLSREQANILIKYGENLLSIGEYTKALAELLKAEEFVQDDSYLKTLIGSAYYGRKDFDSALINYNEALKLDPTNTEVHYNIGLIHMSKGTLEQAKTEFNICLRDLKYKKQFLPLTSLGIISFRENKEEEGLNYFRKAIEAEPSYSDAYYYIGMYHLGKKEYHEALSYLDGATKQNSNNIAAYMAIGRAYEALGRKQEAASAYGYVASKAPHTPAGIEAQANVRRVLGYN